MKQLLNTLFVTSEDIYLSLEGENVLANRDKNRRRPLSAAHAASHRQFLLCRCLPRADGKMRGGRDRSGLLLPAWAFPRPHLRPRAAATCCSGVNSTVLPMTPPAVVR